MTDSVNQRTILITGASSGFGKAAAVALAQDKHRIIAVARRRDRLDELRKTLPSEVYTAALDVTDKAAVTDFFHNLPKSFQTIDVLINNAGLAIGMDLAQDSSVDDWDVMIDTNIKGLLYITRPVLDIMVTRNTGHIINIGSMAAENPYTGGNVYGATKAFVRMFSKNLRTDLFGKEIKVTTIEPGIAETEFSEVRFGDKAKAKKYYQGTRPLVAEDIARTIVWILNQPAHVNIESIEIMTLDQTYAGFTIRRNS